MNFKEAANDVLRDPEVWRKFTTRIEPKDIHDIYDIHDNNGVNDIEEFNLLHDILNPSNV